MITTAHPSSRSPLSTVLAAAFLLSAAALLGVGDAAARQFDLDRDGASTVPEDSLTIEGILTARQEGQPPAEIVARIKESGASFDLSLAEALDLRSKGLESEILAAMAGLPPDRTAEVLASLKEVRPPAEPPDKGLSKRRILKMIEGGTSEAEILAEIARGGSKASLTLEEAEDLRSKGVTPTLLAAIVTGQVAAAPTAASSAPPPSAAPAAVSATTAPIAPPPSAIPTAAATAAPAPVATAPREVSLDEIPESPEEEAPLLDEMLAGEEDEEELEAVPGEEGVEEWSEEGPLLDEVLDEQALADAEAAKYLTVLSDTPGAHVFKALGTARPADLLKRARSAGKTPARVRLGPGAHFILVEKPIDEFDRSILPAFRTLLDQDGTTRTLIVSGQVYYDAERCCLPRGLGGGIQISRILEDAPGVVLGDDLEGLPSYLWDGNRFLILSLRRGRIDRVIKVYRVRKAAYEARTLVATFVPASSDPLSASIPDGAAEADEEEAIEVWEPLPEPDLAGVGKILGIPKADLDRLGPILAANGKATWRRPEADGALSLLTFSLDTKGRARYYEMKLRRDGPRGTFSTPAPPSAKKKAKKAAPPAPPPLPTPTVETEVELDLPLLLVENGATSAVLVRAGDGTFTFVPPGQSREMTLAPGTLDLEARFESQPDQVRTVRTRAAYHRRYTLSLR